MKKISMGRRGRIGFRESGVATVRLDPETRYLVDLAARIESRTFNSFIEWAAKDALGRVRVPGVENTTVSDIAGQVWSVDEVTRFLALMFNYPRLLDVSGQSLRVLIQNHGGLWKGDSRTKEHRGDLDEDRLRENWEKFKAVAEGKADPSTLPKWEKTKKKEK